MPRAATLLLLGLSGCALPQALVDVFDEPDAVETPVRVEPEAAEEAEPPDPVHTENTEPRDPVPGPAYGIPPQPTKLKSKAQKPKVGPKPKAPPMPVPQPDYGMP